MLSVNLIVSLAEALLLIVPNVERQANNTCSTVRTYSKYTAYTVPAHAAQSFRPRLRSDNTMCIHMHSCMHSAIDVGARSAHLAATPTRHSGFNGPTGHVRSQRTGPRLRGWDDEREIEQAVGCTKTHWGGLRFRLYFHLLLALSLTTVSLLYL